MSTVRVATHLRVADGSLVAIEEAPPIEQRSCDYLRGAISLDVDGREVLGVDLEDDVNWLWPSLVQALEECRRAGRGELWFPDQPIRFVADGTRVPGRVHLSVTADSLRRAAMAPADVVLPAVARAALQFADGYERTCPDLPPTLRTCASAWLESAGS